MDSSKHTPTPWVYDEVTHQVWDAQQRTIIDMDYGDQLPDTDDANAVFIVRAVNSHVRWAKWIAKRGNDLPDHACAECVPGGDLVKAGFQCVYHEALAAAEAA